MRCVFNWCRSGTGVFNGTALRRATDTRSDDSDTHANKMGPARSGGRQDSRPTHRAFSFQTTLSVLFICVCIFTLGFHSQPHQSQYVDDDGNASLIRSEVSHNSTSSISSHIFSINSTDCSFAFHFRNSVYR